MVASDGRGRAASGSGVGGSESYSSEPTFSGTPVYSRNRETERVTIQNGLTGLDIQSEGMPLAGGTLQAHICSPLLQPSVL